MKQLPNEGIAEFIVRFRDAYKSVITAGGTAWCPSLLATRYMQKLSFARYGSMYADMMNADRADNVSDGTPKNLDEAYRRTVGH